MPAFRHVALVGRTGSAHVVDALRAVLAALETAGAEVTLESATAGMLGCTGGIARDRLGERAELVVVVGGDGSILGVARDVADTGVPVLGVNRGGLGFLADIAPDQISGKVAAVLRGEHTVEDRFLLDARVYRDGEEVTVATALNDVVVHAGSMSRMMDLRLAIDDEFVYDQRSDGLIVSTPTGSTAYALSAGGPIMHPKLDAVVIVPMFPHTLASRPLVVHGASRISVRFGDAAATPRVSCDSQVDQELEANDEVRIAKHPHPLRLAFPVTHNFYESCRSKLDWATRLGDRGAPRLGDRQGLRPLGDV